MSEISNAPILSLRNEGDGILVYQALARVIVRQILADELRALARSDSSEEVVDDGQNVSATVEER